jgi:hypothetical protein
MKNTHKAKIVPSADDIAAEADQGKDVSRHFTNTGRMMPPVRRVNVDFAEEMLMELDDAVRSMNVSRQAVIKFMVREGLDRLHLAQDRRRAAAQIR